MQLYEKVQIITRFIKYSKPKIVSHQGKQENAIKNSKQQILKKKSFSKHSQINPNKEREETEAEMCALA